MSSREHRRTAGVAATGRAAAVRAKAAGVRVVMAALAERSAAKPAGDRSDPHRRRSAGTGRRCSSRREGRSASRTCLAASLVVVGTRSRRTEAGSCTRARTPPRPNRSSRRTSPCPRLSRYCLSCSSPRTFRMSSVPLAVAPMAARCCVGYDSGRWFRPSSAACSSRTAQPGAPRTGRCPTDCARSQHSLGWWCMRAGSLQSCHLIPHSCHDRCCSSDKIRHTLHNRLVQRVAALPAVRLVLMLLPDSAPASVRGASATPEAY